MKHARVVGAGLSGLAAAWHLRDAGFDVQVVDAAARPGGMVQTTETKYGLVESAANAFTWTSTTERWFHQLRLEPLFPRKESSRRYIFRDGRPRRWPLSPSESLVLATKLAGSWITRTLSPHASENVRDYAGRIAGRAATDWLIGPALAGVYAASPDELSAAAIFAGRKRTRVRSVVAPGGMGEFVARVHETLQARGVSFAWGQPVERLDPAIPTVVATNAAAAHPLLLPHAPDLSRTIARLPMTGLVTATAFFEPDERDLDGFGVLFPRGCGVKALGVLFNSSIFDGRGPHRSETWIFGADAVHGHDDSSLARVIVADRGILTGRKTDPMAVFQTRHEKALPVYTTGILEVARLADSAPRWLAVTGNYLGRIGVTHLLENAANAAARLAATSSAR